MMLRSTPDGKPKVKRSQKPGAIILAGAGIATGIGTDIVTHLGTGRKTRMSIAEWVTKKREHVHWVDTIAQIFFPGAFGVFNIIYWTFTFSKILIYR